MKQKSMNKPNELHQELFEGTLTLIEQFNDSELVELKSKIESLLKNREYARANIKEEDFKIYENIRLSGRVNMLDVGEVIKLSRNRLTQEIIFNIMKNYTYYKHIWGGM